MWVTKRQWEQINERLEACERMSHLLETCEREIRQSSSNMLIPVQDVKSPFGACFPGAWKQMELSTAVRQLAYYLGVKFTYDPGTPETFSVEKIKSK